VPATSRGWSSKPVDPVPLCTTIAARLTKNKRRASVLRRCENALLDMPAGLVRWVGEGVGIRTSLLHMHLD
jgi:hypothetical protein